MTRSFYFDFAEEKTKPIVLCKSWLKGKFPACVMTIILIVANLARRRVLFVDPVTSKNIEDGFQISVVHSFVCGWLKSRQFFSQCAIHSSFCPQSFFFFGQDK